jgi:hypothetical protein
MQGTGRIGYATLLALLALGAAAPPADDNDARVGPALEQARTAANGLTARLKKLLLTELKAGGFEGAARACTAKAQQTTHALSERLAVDIRRVSLRNRNAANAPDAFERRVLESFERLPAGTRSQAEHVEVVRAGERDELRYMRPLMTGPMCLSCHGKPQRLSGGVRAVLAEGYPNDLATGFKVGDVRGAVSVRIALAPRSDH